MLYSENQLFAEKLASWSVSIFWISFNFRIFVLHACFGFAYGEEDIRTWTDKGGRTLEAKFIEHIGDKIKIQRKDGRTFTLSPGLFSEQDRKYLESLASKQVFKPPEPFPDNYKGAIVIIGISGKVTIWKRRATTATPSLRQVLQK